MDLSIVIPTFNEATKIAADVQAAAGFLRRIGYTGEVVVVDDGSRDGTAEAASRVSDHEGASVNVVRYHPHRGKGYALRRGMEVTSGKVVMFVDSGSCVPLTDALAGIEWIRTGQCELAHGSRKLPESIIERPQNAFRQTCSRLFKWVMYRKIHLPVELSDTQCGFKIYHGDVARQIYARCKLDGFLIDVEVIIRAWRAGYRIREFPIHWTNDPDSRTRPLKHIGSIWRETRYIQRLLRDKD